VLRPLLTGGLCLALGACASAPAKTLPTCDGQHRRPANPNGSVLPSPDAAHGPAAPGPAAPATPPPAASFAPCGDPA
jgi:hypothetical protein